MPVLVSVIVPSLNVRDYIRECIDSIIGQSLPDIEIICVDAGSSDGTYEILQEYAEKDGRVKPIKSSKRSYGYQVNLGIETAKGEYIGIVESDDYIDRDMMKYLYLRAKEFDVDVSKGDNFRVCGASPRKYNCVEQHVFSGSQLRFYNKRIENDELLFRHIVDQNLWSGIYRRAFLIERKIKLNETPGAAFQDMGFQQQVQTLAGSVVYGDKAVYFYRTDREDSSTNQPKWMQNVVQEFKFLEDSYLWQEKEGELHRPYVIARLAVSFMTELRRMIVNKRFSLEADKWLNDYGWLQIKFQELVNNGDLDYWQLPRWMWEHLMLALKSLQSYTDFIWMTDEVRRGDCDKLASLFDAEAYVIFSCGAWGKNLFDFLRGQGKNVLVFTDNNNELWGTKCCGIDVVSPQEAVMKYSGYKFVVANQYYGEKLKHQLRDLGIDENMVIVYHPI